jgi:signal transduction histidine kinase
MTRAAPVFARSWFARVATTFAMLFTALMAVTLVGVWLIAAQIVDGHARATLEADLASFSEAYAQRLLPGLREAVERRAADAGDSRLVLLIGRQGETLAGNRERIPAALLHADSTPRRAGPWLGLARPLLGGFTLALAHDRAGDDAILRNLAIALAGIGLIAALFSVAGGLVIGQTTLARVDSINATLRKVGEGDLAVRAPVAANADEFATLAAGLNATLERMGALVEGLKSVSDRVAHEMRTPLAHLRAGLEEARRAAPIDLARKLGDLSVETDEMIAVFAALLDVATTEAAAGDPRGLRAVDLDAIVEDAVELYDAVAEERGVAVAFAPRAGAALLGDRHLLLRMVANLVDNAIKFSAPGGRVDIATDTRGGEIVLSIRDHGPGLPDGFNEKVFNRFTRAPGAAETPGHGLGLALVRAIATRHGMKIVLTNAKPGLLVEVRARRLDAAKPVADA